jgi:hypothetical protein
VKSAPSGDSGDALERLQDEQWHILELLDTYARYRRDPDHSDPESARLASLISKLVRMHFELETLLLDAQPSGDAAIQLALAQASAKRKRRARGAGSRRGLVAARPGAWAGDGRARAARTRRVPGRRADVCAGAPQPA